jgi:hypothetical protein
MDLFAGWSSPLVYSKPRHQSTSETNPLLLLQQQQRIQSITPASVARTASVQFAGNTSIIGQAYEENENLSAADGDDDEPKSAWAQNRCLLCLLYEEKLRVLQRKVDELEASGAKPKTTATRSRANSDASKHQSEIANVAHSTVVGDPKQFLSLIAKKDEEIAEKEKTMNHLAIDRDNLRAALDETQMKLEVAVRRLMELENQPASFYHLASSSSSSSMARAQNLSSVVHHHNSRSSTPVPRLKPNEQLRPEHTSDILGVSAHMNNDQHQQQQNFSSSASPALTLAGLSPLHPATTTTATTQRQNDVSTSEELSARRKAVSPVKRSSTTAKLTKDIANDLLGMFPETHLAEPPNSLKRRGIGLPSPGSLHSVTMAAPSEESWRIGGKKPGLIDLNAKGTPAKSSTLINNSQNNSILSSAARRNNNNVSVVGGRSISPVPAQNSQYQQYNNHSPHYQTFGPVK